MWNLSYSITLHHATMCEWTWKESIGAWGILIEAGRCAIKDMIVLCIDLPSVVVLMKGEEKFTYHHVAFSLFCKVEHLLFYKYCMDFLVVCKAFFLYCLRNFYFLVVYIFPLVVIAIFEADHSVCMYSTWQNNVFLHYTVNASQSWVLQFTQGFLPSLGATWVTKEKS